MQIRLEGEKRGDSARRKNFASHRMNKPDTSGPGKGGAEVRGAGPAPLPLVLYREGTTASETHSQGRGGRYLDAKADRVDPGGQA